MGTPPSQQPPSTQHTATQPPSRPAGRTPAGRTETGDSADDSIQLDLASPRCAAQYRARPPGRHGREQQPLGQDCNAGGRGSTKACYSAGL